MPGQARGVWSPLGEDAIGGLLGAVERVPAALGVGDHLVGLQPERRRCLQDLR